MQTISGTHSSLTAARCGALRLPPRVRLVTKTPQAHLPPKPLRAASLAPTSPPPEVDHFPCQPPTAPSATHGPFQGFGRALGQMQNMAALAFPIASLTSAGSTLELYGAVAKGMEIYLVVLTVRVLLSWFRNISWHSEPFNTIRQFTDPYLNMFRGVIPPIGGMDLSPMLGFFLLSFVAKQLKRMSYGL